MVIEAKRPSYQRGFDDVRSSFSTALFLRKNCGPNIKTFLQELKEPSLFRIENLVINLHKDFKRKATKDPYLKHVYYTAFLCYQQSKDPVFIAGALLHDLIELKRKNHQKITKNNLFNLLTQSGINESEAEKISKIVSFLTPPERDNSKYTSKIWIDRKRENFNKIMNHNPSRRLTPELLEMARQIKIADEAANIKETVEDVKSGNDGPNIKIYKHKPFTNRVTVFKERIKIIAEKYPNHQLLFQLQRDLYFLKRYLQPA